MNKHPVPSRNSIIYLLLVVASVIFAATTFIVYNNSFRSLPLFFFLMLVGISLMLAFGLVRGGAGGLIVISLWIGLKRSIGVWQDIFMLTNVLELGLVLVLFAICGVYNDRLRLILDAYFNSVARLELLNLEDTRIGLIKAAIGKLRLQEEEERSVRYRRPFSLLLIQVQSKPEHDLDPDSEAILMRSVANTVKSTTRHTDIPFLAASDQIALILPETDILGATRVFSNIMERMLEAHFLSDLGLETSLQDAIQLRYAVAAFTGNSRVKIDMLQAAEHSLERILSKGASNDFQNTLLEWEYVGDAEPVNFSPPTFTPEEVPVTPPVISGSKDSARRFDRLIKSDTTPRKDQVARQEGTASDSASSSEKIRSE